MASMAAAPAAWTPPAAPGPFQYSKLPRVPGGATQNERSKQECYCPVCPPPPAEGSHTAQRRNFRSHFANQHAEYTFVDDAQAAALHSKPLAAFFRPAAQGTLVDSYLCIYVVFTNYSPCSPI